MERKICACPLDCFDVCSMIVSVEEGRITNIEGNKEHPVTNGFICEKGKKHLQRLYSPMRLKYPMRKCSNGWEQITWDQAFELMEEKLEKALSEGGTQAVANYSDGGASGLLKNVEDLFFECLGQSSKYDAKGVTGFYGSLCWGAGIEAQTRDFGKVLSHRYDDLLNARNIIIWGMNPSETNIHLMPFIKKAREKGARVILVDPIRTATAAHCDVHIQIKPKGDLALISAVAKRLFEKKRCDEAFLTAHILGVEELRNTLLGMDMDVLLAASGIDMTDVDFLADVLSLGKPASFQIGYGVQRYLYGGLTIRGIDMLGAISGNIGISGGGVNYANKVVGPHIKWPAFKNTGAGREISKPAFGRAVKAMENPKIKVLFISRSNPAVQSPNSSEVLEALEAIDFKVVIDHFMTDTAALADLVLPAAYFLEEEDIIYSSMWHHCIHYNQKAVEPYFEAKSELDIYTTLAGRLGLDDFPNLSSRQWIEMLLAGLVEKGLDYKVLAEKGYQYLDINEDIPWKDWQFATSSGKFELLDPQSLMEYMCSVDTDGQTYRLLTVHSRHSLHSQHFIDTKEEMPLVYLNVIDMKKLNINDNDTVHIYNKYGSLKARARVSDNSQPGIIFMHEGWWQKNGGSVNMLTPDQVSDMGNQAVYNECTVNIERLVK